MKIISATSRFLLKTVAVLGLLTAAGTVGVGIAAFFAFHESNADSGVLQSTRVAGGAEQSAPPRLIPIDRLELWQEQQITMDVDASLAANRFVAADSADKARFIHADYQLGEADRSASNKTGLATIIPPPLRASSDEIDFPSAPNSPESAAMTPLSDPGSRYIVDRNTGRIVGIDGRAGASEEQAREQQPLRQAAVSEQRTPLVLAALPVDDAASPMADLPPPKPDLYPAVRRAMPMVAAEDEPTQPFSVSNEIADNDLPVARAKAVTITQPVKAPRRLLTFP